MLPVLLVIAVSITIGVRAERKQEPVSAMQVVVLCLLALVILGSRRF